MYTESEDTGNRPASTLKRSAELISSAKPAKRAKHPQDEKPVPPAAAKAPLDALAFLKSRPQIAAMSTTMRKDSMPSAVSQSLQPVQALSGPIEDPKPTQRVENLLGSARASAIDSESTSWESQHETVLEFLRRLPVADPATADAGPWLWVRCPRELQDWNRTEDLEAFLDTAAPLLDALLEHRRKVDQQNPGKAVGTITRKMGPYRDQLEIDLLNTATKHSLTSGKWMLFPMSDDLPLVWRLVAEATAAGNLGPVSKVGIWEPTHATKPTVICVYTKDFSDLNDVKRVLSNLNELNIVNKAAKISYKCDAYTHLGIMSDNSFKLRASLYSSEEVRGGKVKYKDGKIIRVKTKNGGLEDFLNS